MQVKSIAIIGTGVIGASWAAFYAAKGLQVNMWDIDTDLCRRGHQQATDFIRQLQTHGILSGDQVEASISRTETAGRLEQTVESVQLVQESVAENYEIKKQVSSVFNGQSTTLNMPYLRGG